MSIRTRIVQATAALTLSAAAVGIVAINPAGDADASRKVNEYEGQHRKVNEYEGQHR